MDIWELYCDCQSALTPEQAQELLEHMQELTATARELLTQTETFHAIILGTLALLGAAFVAWLIFRPLKYLLFW